MALLALGDESQGTVRPCVVDYDSDGDLDLVVGGYSHFSPPKRELTEQDRKRVAELQALIAAADKELETLMQKAFAGLSEDSTPEDQQAAFTKLFASEEHKKAREGRATAQGELDQLPESLR